MAVYEVLLRGKEDGSLSGAHTIEFEPDGTSADGSSRYKVGTAKPLDPETLAQYVGEQFAGVPAQVLALTAERDAAVAAKDAAETAKVQAEQTIASLQAEIATLRAQPTPEPEPTVPTVTALQGRLAINTVEGLRARIEAAVAAGDQNTKDLWEFATVWHRDNALLVGLSQAVGLGDEHVDALFALGKTL